MLLSLDGHIKLADFGLSKENIDLVKLTKSFCGSPEYMSPEMLKLEGHNLSLDFYSLGAILYSILTGLPPHYSENREIMFNKILNEDIPLSFPENLSEEVKDLMSKLLTRNPNERIGHSKGIEEIKEHPWCQDIDWKDYSDKKVTPPFIPGIYDSHFDPEYASLPIDLKESDNEESISIYDEGEENNQAQNLSKYNDFTYIESENSIMENYTKDDKENILPKKQLDQKVKHKKTENTENYILKDISQNRNNFKIFSTIDNTSKNQCSSKKINEIVANTTLKNYGEILKNVKETRPFCASNLKEEISKIGSPNIHSILKSLKKLPKSKFNFVKLHFPSNESGKLIANIKSSRNIKTGLELNIHFFDNQKKMNQGCQNTNSMINLKPNINWKSKIISPYNASKLNLTNTISKKNHKKTESLFPFPLNSKKDLNNHNEDLLKTIKNLSIIEANLVNNPNFQSKHKYLHKRQFSQQKFQVYNKNHLNASNTSSRNINLSQIQNSLLCYTKLASSNKNITKLIKSTLDAEGNSIQADQFSYKNVNNHFEKSKLKTIINSLISGTSSKHFKFFDPIKFQKKQIKASNRKGSKMDNSCNGRQQELFVQNKKHNKNVTTFIGSPSSTKPINTIKIVGKQIKDFSSKGKLKDLNKSNQNQKPISNSKK